MTRRLVVVSAGLSTPSSTRLLADRLAAATVDAAAGDLEVTTLELRDHAHEITDALLNHFASGSLRTSLDDVRTADGLIVVTPTFNASYSGLFKSFFDIVEHGDLRGTPVLLAATGGTERHSLVVEHALRPMFSYLGALTAPTAVYAASSDWGSTGGELQARITRAGREFADLLDGRTVAASNDPFADVTSFEQLLPRRA